MPRLRDIEFSIQLGAAIRARRGWLDLSQSEIGKRVGISGYQLAKYESGESSASALMLVRLATALETTVNGLLGFDRRLLGSAGHLRELSEILTDDAIAAVVKAMQAMSEPKRSQVADIVEAYAVGLTT